MSKPVSILRPEIRSKLQRLSNLKRFNYRVRIHEESVAEHSFYVALYSLAICEQLCLNNDITFMVVSKALIHDVCEIHTSDIPYPVKQEFPEIKQLLDTYENSFLRNYFSEIFRRNDKFSTRDQELVECVVKMADILSCWQFSEVEIGFGNLKYFGEIEDDSKTRLKKQFEKIKPLLGIERIPNWLALKEMVLGKDD